MANELPPKQEGMNIKGVPPGPLPWSVSVSHVQVSMENPVTGQVEIAGMVQVALSDPSGVKIQFWDVESAKKVGQDIISHAYQAKTGLEIVGKQPIIQAVPEVNEDGQG